MSSNENYSWGGRLSSVEELLKNIMDHSLKLGTSSNLSTKSTSSNSEFQSYSILVDSSGNSSPFSLSLSSQEETPKKDRAFSQSTSSSSSPQYSDNTLKNSSSNSFSSVGRSQSISSNEDNSSNDNTKKKLSKKKKKKKNKKKLIKKQKKSKKRMKNPKIRIKKKKTNNNNSSSSISKNEQEKEKEKEKRKGKKKEKEKEKEKNKDTHAGYRYKRKHTQKKYKNKIKHKNKKTDNDSNSHSESENPLVNNTPQKQGFLLSSSDNDQENRNSSNLKIKKNINIVFLYYETKKDNKGISTKEHLKRIIKDFKKQIEKLYNKIGIKVVLIKKAAIHILHFNSKKNRLESKGNVKSDQNWDTAYWEALEQINNLKWDYNLRYLIQISIPFFFNNKSKINHFEKLKKINLNKAIWCCSVDGNDEKNEINDNIELYQKIFNKQMKITIEIIKRSKSEFSLEKTFQFLQNNYFSKKNRKKKKKIKRRGKKHKSHVKHKEKEKNKEYLKKHKKKTKRNNNSSPSTSENEHEKEKEKKNKRKKERKRKKKKTRTHTLDTDTNESTHKRHNKARKKKSKGIAKEIKINDTIIKIDESHWTKFVSAKVLTLDPGISLRKLYDTVSNKGWLEQEREFRIYKKIFAKGSFRDVFLMMDKKGTIFVLKLFRDQNETEEILLNKSKQEVCISAIARNYAKRFLSEGPPRSVDFVIPFVLDFRNLNPQFGSRNNRHNNVNIKYAKSEISNLPLNSLICNGEIFLQGTFRRYTNNWNYKNMLYADKTVFAFSHFTYDRSNEKLMIVDLQGVGNILTDPAIHNNIKKNIKKKKQDQKLIWMNDNDLNLPGIVEFFKSHVCSKTCTNLNLKENKSQNIKHKEKKNTNSRKKSEKYYQLVCSNHFCSKRVKLKSKFNYDMNQIYYCKKCKKERKNKNYEK
ncbi:eukaryotic elongation factor 2 kinase-related [Anaeramoeba flamelloides]|uniref:Eukaryotic elongation factor 2 kinase-related n=1 Tax=Anaeramoeba flamelloides TaxID=1746091 RepID=A0ABQ8X6X1_9EUKA|nr:eukaryotic elongation factor 2 kinase-related [Anaeramoeba flamelloides]